MRGNRNYGNVNYSSQDLLQKQGSKVNFYFNFYFRICTDLINTEVNLIGALTSRKIIKCLSKGVMWEAKQESILMEAVLKSNKYEPKNFETQQVRIFN